MRWKTAVRAVRGAVTGLSLALAAAVLAQTSPSPAQFSEPDKTYAPPRSVADIIGSTGTLRGDSAEHERRRRLLASEPPANAGRRELVAFHFRRARAADALGDSARAVLDYRKAFEHSQPGESYGQEVPNRRWIVNELSIAEFTNGNFAEATRLRRMLIDEMPGDAGWKVISFMLLARGQAWNGELPELENTVRQADAALALARNAPDAWAVWGSSWTAANHHTHAWHHYAFGRYAEAELEALRALRSSEEFVKAAAMHRARGVPMGSADFPTRWHEDIESSLSIVQVALGKLNEAEYHSRKVLASMLARFRHANTVLVQPLARLGENYVAAGRFADAEALLREGLRIRKEAGALPDSLGALGIQRRLVHAVAAQERWSDAATLYRELRSHAVSGMTGHHARMDAPATYAQLRTGQAEAAATAAAERVAWYAANGLLELPEAILLRGVYAMALSESGRRPEADSEFQPVIEKLTGRGAPSILAADATAFIELQKRWIVEGYVEHLRRKAADTSDSAARARWIEEALAVSDAARGRGVQLAIQQASLRAAARTPALAELARKEQDLRSEIGTLYAFLNTRLGAAGGESGGLERQMRERIAAASAELARAAERMRLEFGDYADLIAPRTPEIAALRAALRPGEALLALHLAGERAFVWLLGREEPVAFHSPQGRQQLEADIRLLRRALDPNSAGIRDHIPAFDVAAAHRLYERLVKPLEPALSGVESLVVVANGALQQVPLAVLVTAPPSGRADDAVLFREYRSVQWLARGFAVSQVPSLSAFLSLRSRPPGREGRLAFAGFGDPIFSKAQLSEAAAAPAVALRGAKLALRGGPQTSGLDSAELARLPRLPDTAEEIVSIAKTLGAAPERDTFLGPRANETEVKRADLASRKVVAFATHGLVPGDLNGLAQPALALSAPEVAGVEGDGLLTMEEVVGLKLDADWVVLSACNTASGQGAGGEALSGLGRTFFYAGARALLASSWPVETVSARLLTTSIFERQVRNPALSRAKALRESMLALMERDEAAPAERKPAYSYAHPLFWAPFSVIGDGG